MLELDKRLLVHSFHPIDKEAETLLGCLLRVTVTNEWLVVEPGQDASFSSSYSSALAYFPLPAFRGSTQMLGLVQIPPDLYFQLR